MEKEEKYQLKPIGHMLARHDRCTQALKTLNNTATQQHLRERSSVVTWIAWHNNSKRGAQSIFRAKDEERDTESQYANEPRRRLREQEEEQLRRATRAEWTDAEKSVESRWPQVPIGRDTNTHLDSSNGSGSSSSSSSSSQQATATGATTLSCRCDRYTRESCTDLSVAYLDISAALHCSAVFY